MYMSVSFNNKSYNSFESFEDDFRELVLDNKSNSINLIKFIGELPSVIRTFSRNKSTIIKQNYINTILNIFSDTIINTTLVKSLLENGTNEESNNDFNVSENDNNNESEEVNVSEFNFYDYDYPQSTYNTSTSKNNTSSQSTLTSLINLSNSTNAPSNRSIFRRGVFSLSLY